jgi:CheY-like chemotaxis protein
MLDNSISDRLRVLVVDDCPDTTATMAVLFRYWGHDVRIAHDGADALRVAAGYRPDVVLVDLAMPGMDGFELARRLRGEGRSRALLVSLSGYGQEQDCQHSREAGCDAHLIKPVDPELLRHLLDAQRGAPREASGNLTESEAGTTMQGRGNGSGTG